MREHKYRAFIKQDKVMLDVIEISWYSKNVRCVEGGMMICPATGATQADFDFPLYEMEDIELLEYTGLKDKNGVEIYDGDVVKIYFDVAEISDTLYLFLTKQQISDGFIIKEVCLPEFYCEPMSDEFEVIGNIHANPELL